ncbi:hypothetical protein [Flavobacterium sp. CS20]|uniref:hypothetical protein n=1 Tax=Flavobacterium sp. CS20 TaxID=2775246 RepID=UPI001B39F874|nr:hypothetical protein [Flavobacterium sp. CS20]QTY27907.1 hypothetical protein IGB25_05220 [Flavobacterium sp. CS20]
MHATNDTLARYLQGEKKANAHKGTFVFFPKAHHQTLKKTKEPFANANGNE